MERPLPKEFDYNLYTMKDMLEMFKKKLSKSGKPQLVFRKTKKDALNKDRVNQKGIPYEDDSKNYILIGKNSFNEEKEELYPFVEENGSLGDKITMDYNPKEKVYVEEAVKLHVGFNREQGSPKSTGTPEGKLTELKIAELDLLYDKYTVLSTNREKVKFLKKIRDTDPELFKAFKRRLSHIKESDINPYYEEFSKMKMREGVAYLEKFLDNFEDDWMYGELLKRLKNDNDDMYKAYKQYFKNLNADQFKANIELLNSMDPSPVPEPETDNLDIDDILDQDDAGNIKKIEYYYQNINSRESFEVDIEFQSGKHIQVSLRPHQYIQNKLKRMINAIELPSKLREKEKKVKVMPKVQNITPEKTARPAKHTRLNVKQFYISRQGEIESLSYESKREDNGVFLDVMFILKSGEVKRFELSQDKDTESLLSTILDELTHSEV